VQDDISNCIYAILAITDQNRSLGVMTLAYGERASWMIVRRLRPGMVDSHTVHEWLNDQLGLAEYPIIHRDGRPGLFGWRKSR
jgi:hypothetical protein